MVEDAPRVRTATLLGWALVFGLVVDLVTDGPPGLGALVGAAVAAAGVAVVARPHPRAIALLIAGLLLVSFTVVRASPVLAGLDLLSGIGLFALAGAFAREGELLRTSLRAYAARGLAWTSSFGPALAMVVRPVTRLLPSSGRARSPMPRALLLSLPVGFAFALLLGSADAVFARLLREPFDHLKIPELPRHIVVVVASGAGFATLAVRSALPIRLARAARPLDGGGLRRADWVSLLATVDAVLAVFVAVQFVAFFGGRAHVLAETGLTFAEYARSGFWQMLAAAILTGLVIAAAWIGGRPATVAERRAFVALASILVALSLVVLVSAFQRLVLYETEFGYTWPRLIPHAAILLIGALLACSLIAIGTGRTTWLPTAGLILGLATLLGLNLLNPEGFIADRNLARVEVGHSLDTAELASLSADAVPAIAAALPELDDPAIRAVLEQHLACLLDELRDGVDRFGWASFNLARDIAIERLARLPLQPC